MTGLNPKIDRILEISTIVTDKDLNILAQGPNVFLYQQKHILKNMNCKNYSIHKNNGLLRQVKASQNNEKDAEKKILKFLKKWVPIHSSPMCGNTISHDRSFLKKFMPKLEEYFHYRNIDVSTIKELVLRWHPSIFKKICKKNIHRTLPDIYESIQELLFYKQHFF